MSACCRHECRCRTRSDNELADTALAKLGRVIRLLEGAMDFGTATSPLHPHREFAFQLEALGEAREQREAVLCVA